MTTWNVPDGEASRDDDPSELPTGRQARLRELRAADLDLVRTWWTDPDIAVLAGDTVRPASDQPSIEMFRPWSLVSRSAAGMGVESLLSGELVGHVTLHDADNAEDRATLTIVLGSDQRGQGFEDDALRLGIWYGFAAMDLRDIELTVWAYRNHGLEQYTEAGFVEVGRQHAVIFDDGVWHDQVTMRLPRADRGIA